MAEGFDLDLVLVFGARLAASKKLVLTATEEVKAVDLAAEVAGREAYLETEELPAKTGAEPELPEAETLPETPTETPEEELPEELPAESPEVPPGAPEQTPKTAPEEEPDTSDITVSRGTLLSCFTSA